MEVHAGAQVWNGSRLVWYDVIRLIERWLDGTLCMCAYWMIPFLFGWLLLCVVVTRDEDVSREQQGRHVTDVSVLVCGSSSYVVKAYSL